MADVRKIAALFLPLSALLDPRIMQRLTNCFIVAKLVTSYSVSFSSMHPQRECAV